MPTTRHQVIRTDGSDELVFLTRIEYDALRAAAGDAAAERRAIDRIIAESDAAIAAGTESVLPDWLARPVARGEAPIKVIREHRRQTRQEFAATAGIPENRLAEIESGQGALDAATRDRLATALDVEPGWLDAG